MPESLGLAAVRSISVNRSMGCNGTCLSIAAAFLRRLQGGQGSVMGVIGGWGGGGGGGGGW